MVQVIKQSGLAVLVYEQMQSGHTTVAKGSETQLAFPVYEQMQSGHKTVAKGSETQNSKSSSLGCAHLS